MNDIVRELNNVIEKYKDKTFYTGELNFVEMAKSCKIAIQDLQEKAERENPKPLTLEELKERENKPVYVKLLNNRTYYKDTIEESFTTWCFINCKANAFKIRTPQGNLLERYENHYGKTWIAYDYEPKEAD
jgi:hypothetical protein